jgi:hypothetical protein
MSRPWRRGSLLCATLTIVLGQDYLATFRNGARSPPRPMTLVLRDDASKNVTLAPGDGVERRARRGLVVDWFDGAATAATFAARTVLSSDRFADLDDADAALARQFVFLDTLAIAPCAEAAAEATPLRMIQAAGLDVNVIAEDPVVAVVKSFASRGECATMQSLAARGGARRRTPLEGGWSHDDPSTGFRRRLGLTYDWDLVGNETLPAALLERAASIAEAFDIHVTTGTFQEPLNIVEYGQFDYYEPHCDVSCERSGPKPGRRVATVLLVCETPKLGGATAFPRHHDRALTLRPAAGDAVFFAYDEKARESLHAGCPVRDGVKRVVSIFLRDGVTASSPASHFDVDGGAAVGVNVAGEIGV